MADSAIQFERRDDCLWLTLSAPGTGNAFSPAVAKDLERILKANQSVPLMVLRSALPRFFCSGGDLTYYQTLRTRTQGLKANRAIARALIRLAAHRAVKLALVDGDCLGGGMELLSSFDVIWATPRAAFGFWQRRIGLSFGWGGGARWRERVAATHLAKLSLEARLIDAREAAHVGLIDRVVSETALTREVAAWLCEQRRLGTAAVNELRRAAHGRDEAAGFSRLWLGPAHRAALGRFANRS